MAVSEEQVLARGRARRRWRAERPADVAKLVRRRAGLTQDEIATLLDVDRSAVSRWEAGERTPRSNVMNRYLELLEKLKDG